MQNSFIFKDISESEIENYIKKMNPNKSVRSDVPSIRFVKLSAKIISPYLSKLYNKCVECGVFPETLKHAEVVPIYKNGKKMMLIIRDQYFFYLHFRKFLRH